MTLFRAFRRPREIGPDVSRRDSTDGDKIALFRRNALRLGDNVEGRDAHKFVSIPIRSELHSVCGNARGCVLHFRQYENFLSRFADAIWKLPVSIPTVPEPFTQCR